MRLALALAAALGSLLINECVYRNTPVTTDENSYVFQAYTFLEGRIARPYPPVAPAFEAEMLIMDPKVGWLSRYSPAHAVWLMPGALLDQPRLMTAVAAGLSVWFLSGCALLLGGSALIVCLLLFSPYFQFMHGTLLSYTSGLAAVSVMWWAYLRWQSGGRSIHAALAGLSWAFLFLNRTYTGLLIALPLGIDALVRLTMRRRDRSQWVGTVLFAACAATGVGLYSLYNYMAIGDPLASTHLYYGQNEWHLGFDDGHGLADGVRQAADNLLLLDRWLFGFHGSLLIVLAACIVGWSSTWTPVCVGCTAAVILGYTAFNYRGFNTCGPYYYFEMLPFLFTFMVLAAVRIRRWSPGRRLLPALVLVLAVTGIAFMWKAGRQTRKERAPDTHAQALIQQAPTKSLIFVSGFPEVVGRNLLLNARGVRSDPLVVANWGKQNVLVVRTFPDRTPYILRPGMERVEPLDVPPRKLTYDVDCDDVELHIGRREKLSGNSASVLVAEAGRDGPGYIALGKRLHVVAGRYRIIGRLDYDHVSPDAPLQFDAVAQDGLRVLSRRRLDGAATNVDVTLSFTVPAGEQVEPRLYYGGSGRVVLHSLRLEEE